MIWDSLLGMVSNDVAVDLKASTVNVTSSNQLDRDAIEAAIDEAGYQYVG